ncbi:MAG: ATP synthase subunit I [Bacillota bacterium]
MSKLSDTRNKVIQWTIGSSFLIILISFFIIDEPKKFSIGLIFGMLIAILNFIELEKTLKKSIKMKPENAQSYATKKYFLRYGITAFVIFVAIKVNHIDLLGTIVGLLLLKFVIFITNLFNDKEYFKRIFRKEG